MKLTPFAVIYGGTLAAAAVLSSTKTLVSGSVAALNAQIAELNANFANYGYAATPNLPLIPAVPTPGSTAPQGIAYFQSAAPGSAGPTYGPSTSYLLIDAFTANGYNDPSAALDLLIADTTLVNLQVAAASLAAAAPPVITVQPTNQSISHSGAGAVALTATGAGVTYAWYIQVLGTSAFQLINAAFDAATFTTVTTNSLTVTAPSVAKYNGSKICCVVSAASGAQSVKSTTITLTAT